MEVSHYFEFADAISGGIAESVRNQRQALDRAGIDYTTAPSLDADVLHCNFMGPRSLYYARKARRNDIPVVVHTHETAEQWEGSSFRFLNPLSGPYRRYLGYAYGLADHLIAPSAYTQEVIRDYTDTPSTVVTNGINADKLDGHEDLRDDYLDRFDLEPPVVGAVGIVLRRKGLTTFIEAARRCPDLDFVWFGHLFDRFLDRTTTKLVEDAPDNCEFTGYVEDIRGAYAATDIFFFPTREENQGMSLLEAAYCGIPPVIRDIPIYEDMFTDGENCRKAATMDGFVHALRELADDPAERDRLGGSAEAVAADHTLDVVADELRAIYDTVQR